MFVHIPFSVFQFFSFAFSPFVFSIFQLYNIFYGGISEVLFLNIFQANNTCRRFFDDWRLFDEK